MQNKRLQTQDLIQEVRNLITYITLHFKPTNKYSLRYATVAPDVALPQADNTYNDATTCIAIFLLVKTTITDSLVASQFVDQLF